MNARGKGEFYYNYKYDILFFKIKERDYQKSLDFGDIIVDIDTEGFITGIQLFDASKMFRLDKLVLREIKNWKFYIKSETPLNHIASSAYYLIKKIEINN